MEPENDGVRKGNSSSRCPFSGEPAVKKFRACNANERLPLFMGAVIKITVTVI